ncbi:signal peptidase I [Carnobacterium gallinarum]|uniref:signal peptidase I n=1 Tax=Carnobacterium gallinarum TaxID=2749 RepID=UPI00068DAEAF|nr:signal peptidase I [Carnobacterium gallinarum]
MDKNQSEPIKKTRKKRTRPSQAQKDETIVRPKKKRPQSRANSSEKRKSSTKKSSTTDKTSTTVKKNQKTSKNTSSTNTKKRKVVRDGEIQRKNPNRPKPKQSTRKKDSTVRSNKKKVQTKSIPIEAPSKKSQIIGTIWNVIFFTFIFFMLGGATLFAVSNQQNKSFFGYRIYNVLTNSMKKTQENQKGNFVAGDMIVVKVTPASGIKVNDIITFVPGKNADAYLTHRVVEKKEVAKQGTTDGEKVIQLITRGDANNSNDPPITGDLVIGKVQFALPFMGSLMSYIRENVVPVLIFVVAFFLLILVLQQYFTSTKETP